mgnify:CR=1 FL=1
MDEKIPYICSDINRVWESTIDYIELAKGVRDRMLHRLSFVENGVEKRVYAIGYSIDFDDMERKLFYFEKNGLPGMWDLKSRKI